MLRVLELNSFLFLFVVGRTMAMAMPHRCRTNTFDGSNIIAPIHIRPTNATMGELIFDVFLIWGLLLLLLFNLVAIVDLLLGLHLALAFLLIVVVSNTLLGDVVAVVVAATVTDIDVVLSILIPGLEL